MAEVLGMREWELKEQEQEVKARARARRRPAISEWGCRLT
jgi:hypothetical protein